MLLVPRYLKGVLLFGYYLVGSTSTTTVMNQEADIILTDLLHGRHYPNAIQLASVQHCRRYEEKMYFCCSIHRHVPWQCDRSTVSTAKDSV